MGDREQADALKVLWGAYESANAQDRAIIETATRKFFEHPYEYVDRTVGALISEWSKKLPMICKAHDAAEDKHPYKKATAPFVSR
jgi:hypothetical protein